MNRKIMILVLVYFVMGFVISFFFYPPKEFYKGLGMSYVTVFFPFAFATYKAVQSGKKS